MRLLKHLVFSLFFAFTFSSFAVDEAFSSETGGLETHAFVSQGFILSLDNNYLAESKDGSFSFSEVGFNITKNIGKNLRLGMQLFAQDLGATGSFDAQFDWYYLTYKWSDEWGISFGRIKLPFGLYNDASDIDAARVPVLLPQSIYPIQNRNFLLAQTGMELFGFRDIGDAGALDYRIYSGTIDLDIDDSTSTVEINRLDIPYIVGGRLLWETPVEGLKFGGSIQKLRLDADITFNSQSAEFEVPALLWVSSAEYSRQTWKIAAEYSRWKTELKSSNTALFPETETVSERAYIMAECRTTSRLQNAIYYSILYPDVDSRSGRENKQNDLALSLRVDLTENWLAKAEMHYIHGTAQVSPSLNDNRARSDLSQDWGVFLLKTTAYF